MEETHLKREEQQVVSYWFLFNVFLLFRILLVGKCFTIPLDCLINPPFAVVLFCLLCFHSDYSRKILRKILLIYFTMPEKAMWISWNWYTDFNLITYCKNAKFETSCFMLEVFKYNFRYLYLAGYAIKFISGFPFGVIPFNTAVCYTPKSLC